MIDGATGQSLSSVASQMGRHHGNHQVELTAAEAKAVVNFSGEDIGYGGGQFHHSAQWDGEARSVVSAGISTTFASNAPSKFKPAGALASDLHGDRTGKLEHLG